MHLNAEVFVKDAMFPLRDDLSLLIAPILCEEVVKCLNCPVSCDHVIPPLRETQLHPLLPESVEMTPHFVDGDLPSQIGLLILHVVFKSPSKFVSALYSRCVKSRNLLILIY